MERDEIIKLARAADFVLADNATDEAISQFRSLIDAAMLVEREACAKVCDDNHWEDHRLFADAIRARGTP